MEAKALKIEKFLSSSDTQFVIPVYQRNYDWTKKQCGQLFDDIIAVGEEEAGENPERNMHFIGSIVYVHDGLYTTSEQNRLMIIDGQQRLTTLTLIYLALHGLTNKLQERGLAEKINDHYLINRHSKEDLKTKLRPTENNIGVLRYLLEHQDSRNYSGEPSGFIENFDYFKGKITEDNYLNVWRGLSRLMFVEISLHRENSPQRIYESLNSTGMPLTQADLIRNYILMGLKPDEQKEAYENYWKPIEKYATEEESKESRVSDYIRDYLTWKHKKIPKKAKVYEDYKAKYPETSVDELKHIVRFAGHYNKLLNPAKEPDRDISLQLEYIRRLEIRVAFPFLMKVYDDYDSSVIDKSTFLEMLDLVQSFVWRRFIAGLPTNALNKIFMGLSARIDTKDYLHSVQKVLLQRDFPNDERIVEALKTKNVYGINPRNRKYLFDRLENFKNREKVVIDGGSVNIEHIFPQSPDPKWREDLGAEEYEAIKANYLHVAGNLTLSGWNPELGNRSFAEKRELYKKSRLWLNKYLADLEKWDKDEIIKRGESIAERFCRIWKYPPISAWTDEYGRELNIFDIDSPKSKKLEYAIFCGQKIPVTKTVDLYAKVIGHLFEKEPDKFLLTGLDEKIELVKNSEDKAASIRQPKALNDTYSVEANNSNKQKFDRMKLALEAFNMQDALIIKFAGD